MEKLKFLFIVNVDFNGALLGHYIRFVKQFISTLPLGFMGVSTKVSLI